MKRLIVLIFMFLSFLSNGQSSFGSTSFSKPKLGGVNITEITTSSISVECPITENGGAAINEWVLYMGTSNPPTTVVFNNPLNNILYGYLPVTIYDYETGLNSSTTYYFKFCASNVAGQTCTGVYSATTGATTSTPTVSTNSATNVGTTSARINGNVNSDGGSTVTERGFYYVLGNLSHNPTSGSSSGSGTGSYYLDLSGLYTAQEYYYRAYAINAIGTSLGSISSFQLNAPSGGIPTVTTTSATNITTGSALTGGNVTYDGGATVTNRGICYGTAANPTTQNQSGTGTGTFSYTMSYLNPSTLYYYRAYATNSYGTAYGTEYSFTTLSTTVTPTVSTTTPTEGYYPSSWVSYIRLVLGGNATADGGYAITDRGIVYSTTDATPLIGETGVTTYPIGSGTGSFSASFQNTNPGTVYYVRAYATNTNGTSYGTVLSYTTCTVMPSYSYAYNQIQRGITINGSYSSFYTSLSAAQQACYDFNNPAGRTITMTGNMLLSTTESLAVGEKAYYDWGNGACNTAVDGYYIRFYSSGTDYIITVSGGVITAITACN